MELSAIKDDDLRKSVEDTIAEKDTRISDLEAQIEKSDVEPDPTDDASDEVKAILKERDEQLAELRKDLDDAALSNAIATIVLVNHSSFDMQKIVEQSNLVIDAVDATRSLGPNPTIIKL